MLCQKLCVVPFGIIATDSDDPEGDACWLPPLLHALTASDAHAAATVRTTAVNTRFIHWAPLKTRQKDSRTVARCPRAPRPVRPADARRWPSGPRRPRHDTRPPRYRPASRTQSLA